MGKRTANEQELQLAALREVREEGGVEAKIVRKLTTDTYFRTNTKKKILKLVTFYLMEWTADIPMGSGFETEKVEWLSFLEAQKRLSYPRERKILDKARAAMDQ